MKGVLTTLLGVFSFLVPVRGQKPKEPLSQVKSEPAAVKPAPARRHKRKPGRSKETGHGWPGQGDPAVEQVRRRIIAREAGGDYQAVDPTGRWFGAYQLHRKTSDAAARRMKRPDLLGTPASEWSPEDQDAAFYVIYDRGRGRKHWFRGRSHCS